MYVAFLHPDTVKYASAVRRVKRKLCQVSYIVKKLRLEIVDYICSVLTYKKDNTASGSGDGFILFHYTCVL